MSLENIVKILIELLEDQEGVKIDYTLKKKEPEEKTA